MKYLALGLVGACAAACAAAPAPSSAPTAAAAPAAAPAAPAADPVLTALTFSVNGQESTATVAAAVSLLDAGAEPRAVIAWRAAGKPIRTAVRLSTRRTGTPQDGSSTRIEDGVAGELVVELMATTTDDDRAVVLAGVIDHARAVEVRDDHPMAGLADATGTCFSFVVSATGHHLARGRGTGMAIDGRPCADAPAWLVDRLADLLLVPLPDAPIGEGARWVVRRPVELGDGLGLWAVEEATYTMRAGQIPELVAIDATSLRVPLTTGDGVLALDADKGAVVAALRELATIPIAELSRGTNTRGSGELRVQVGRELPVAGFRDVTSVASLEVEVEVDGQPVPMELIVAAASQSKPLWETDAGAPPQP